MTELTKRVETEEEMLALGAHLAAALPAGFVMYLHGTLGAGKTTLTRGILRGFGHQGKVKSPTYTLVEPYILDSNTIYHFDLYRLRDPMELDYMGIQDYFTTTAICLVEWPDKGESQLPPADLDCYIEFMGDAREVRFEAHTAKGAGVLKALT